MASLWDNLNGDFASRLHQMVAESGGRITLVSGYRSPQRQAQLWADALAKYGSAAEARKWVAPPEGAVDGAKGSMHTKGLAVDLGGDLQLAHLLAPKYGLYFPMSWEPWHVQPVGYSTDSSSLTAQPEDGMASQTDHVDKIFQGLMSDLGAADTSTAGEYANTGAASSTANTGEFSSPTLGEGSTTGLGTMPTATADTGEAGMSGATQITGGTAEQNRKLGQQIASSYGWNSGAQWDALNKLIASESGWMDAANPNSTARGIGQNINGYGDNYKQGDINGQIEWTYNYIKNRYGDPLKAWQHKIDTRGQYGNAGGWY